MAAEIHVGDVGTVFTATIKDQDSALVPLGSATVKTMTFRKPDGSVIVKTGVINGDGSDGTLSYATTASTELSQPGSWQVQSYIELPSGKWHTDTFRFTVYANL